MNKVSLANRFSPPVDGWIQLSPVGKFPHATGVVQIVDAEALSALVNSYEGDLLLDFDHESSDPNKRTTAAGWIDRIEARGDGLWAHVRWSEAGDRALANGEYRFVSPVWDVEPITGNDVRPVRLLEAGLTNKPNLKSLKPISNREHDANGGTNGQGKTAEAATKENQTTMKLVNRALDLSPDASEDAAIAGIEKLKTERADLGTKLANSDQELTKAKTELANRDATIVELNKKVAAADQAAVDAELTAAGITDAAERKSFGSLLLANRETGKAALDAVVAARKEAADAKAKSAAPLTNRQTAKTPDGNDKKELTGIARTRAALESERNKEEI